jgi:hypothetical protein
VLLLLPPVHGLDEVQLTMVNICATAFALKIAKSPSINTGMSIPATASRTP